MRIPEYLDEIIKVISRNNNSRPSTIARNVLNLLNYLKVIGNMDIRSHDDQSLVIIPQSIFLSILKRIEAPPQEIWEYYLDLGDRLGIYFNDQFRIGGKQQMSDRLAIIHMSGIFSMVFDANGYALIPTVVGPLDFINAFMYRILQNNKMPPSMTMRHSLKEIEALNQEIASGDQRKTKSQQQRKADLEAERIAASEKRREVLQPLHNENNIAYEKYYSFEDFRLGDTSSHTMEE
jgi:hypothetical protein